MGDLWSSTPRIDVVITAFDLMQNKTCFIKPWKSEYALWPVVKAVFASSAVPTYFPVVEGRYVDGGVGSYANPCYVAAYEIKYCLGWDPAETTPISLGTGRDPHAHDVQKVLQWQAWQWISPLLGAFMASAADQQVHLVDTFFTDLDFAASRSICAAPSRWTIRLLSPSSPPMATSWATRSSTMISTGR